MPTTQSPALHQPFLSRPALAEPALPPRAVVLLTPTGFHVGHRFRRSSAAWHWGPDGRLSQVGDDEARFEYDPVTKIPLGLLAEEARTNRFATSDQSGFGALDAGAGTTELDETVASSEHPLAAVHGVLRHGVVSSGARYAKQNVTLASTGSHVLSVFIKPVSGLAGVRKGGNLATSGQNLWIDASGTITEKGAGFGRAWVTALDDGWYRLAGEITDLNSTSGTLYFGIRSGEAYFAGAQMEEGAFATAYIPTDGATVTRAGESPDLTDLAFFRQGEGTFLLELRSTEAQISCGGLADTDSGVSFVYANVGATDWKLFDGNNGASYGADSQLTPQSTLQKFAHAVQGGRVQTAYQGALVASNPWAPPVTQGLRVGGRLGGDSATGRIIMRRLVYWPYRLADADLRRITA